MKTVNFSRKKNVRERGFTLVELLMALFVFSILSVLAFKAINFFSNTSESLNKESSHLSDLSKLFVFIENDLRTAQSLTISDQTLQIESHNLMQVSGAYIEHNPFRLPVHSVCISYESDASNVVSRNLSLCDSPEEKSGVKKIVFSPENSRLMFSPITDAQSGTLGVEVSWLNSDFGEVTRLFRIASLNQRNLTQ